MQKLNLRKSLMTILFGASFMTSLAFAQETSYSPPFSDLIIPPTTRPKVPYQFDEKTQSLACWDAKKVVMSDTDWNYNGRPFGHGLPVHLHNHLSGQIDRADSKGNLYINNYDEKESMLVTCQYVID